MNEAMQNAGAPNLQMVHNDLWSSCSLEAATLLASSPACELARGVSSVGLIELLRASPQEHAYNAVLLCFLQQSQPPACANSKGSWETE